MNAFPRSKDLPKSMEDTLENGQRLLGVEACAKDNRANREAQELEFTCTPT